MKYLQYLWASPVTILGLLYVGIFSLLGYYRFLGRYEHTLVWIVDQEKSPDFLYNFWKSWSGHCIGNVVVLKKFSENILIHEQEHVRQMMVLGIFQPIFYALFSIVIKLSCKQCDWYYSNPFEIEARRAAGQVVDAESFIKFLKKSL